MSQKSTRFEYRQTKEKLLEAALDVFAENGYDGTTTREICRRVGVNMATLNYHFGSKENLWNAVCMESAGRLSSTLSQSLDVTLSPADVIQKVVDALFDTVLADPRPIRIAMWGSLQAPSMDEDATFDAFRPTVNLASAFLKKMQADGVLRPDVDIEAAAMLLYSQFMYTFLDQVGHRHFFGKDFQDPQHKERFKRITVQSAKYLLGLSDQRVDQG